MFEGVRLVTRYGGLRARLAPAADHCGDPRLDTIAEQAVDLLLEYMGRHR